MPWPSLTGSWCAKAWDLVPTTGPSSDDPLSSILGAVLFVLYLPLMIPALLITPFYLLELLAQLLCLPLAMLLRAVGALDTEVRIRRGDMLVHRERVSGWSAARRRGGALVAWFRAHPDLGSYPA